MISDQSLLLSTIVLNDNLQTIQFTKATKIYTLCIISGNQ